MTETPSSEENNLLLRLVSPLFFGLGAIYAAMGGHMALAELDLVDHPVNLTPENGFGTVDTMLLGAFGLALMWYTWKPMTDGARAIMESCNRITRRR